MARRRETDLRLRGMGLGLRFTLTMSVALLLVMAVAAFVLTVTVTAIAEDNEADRISEAVVLQMDEPEFLRDSGGRINQKTDVRIYPGRLGGDEGTEFYFERKNPTTDEVETNKLVVPGGASVTEGLTGMIIATTLLVVVVGAGVAFWVAKQVARPILHIIEDVRQIAKGELDHKTRAVGGGEVELLARSIDRMTRDLADAQEAQLELSVRERELELAAGVREALLPLTTPMVEGYDLGAAHLSTSQFGGDFHDFVELPDGRVGLLVCDVSGDGVPAALVGSTARSYLRAELEAGGDVAEAFHRINRWLVGDVRRGMFVTALYVLIDPRAATARVACAGHKIPLLRYSGADGTLRVVHPEGIALAFDKGPVFERRLEIQEVGIEPGDRLLLCNSAPVSLENEDGEELGERRFYSRVLKHAPLETAQFLKALRRDVEAFSGEEGLSKNVSFVTISRESRS